MSRLILPTAFANARRGPMATVPPEEGTQTVAYTEDTTSRFINPERGWMERTDRFTDISGVRDPKVSWGVPEGCSVAWTSTQTDEPFILDEFLNSSISQTRLDAISAWFTEYRSQGVKVKVRFAYNYTGGLPPDEPSYSQIINHLGDLLPIVNANRDIITVVDFGFAGPWGEWHSSNLSTSEKMNIVAYCLDNTHSDVKFGFRYPVWNGGVASYFDGSGGERVDCYTHDYASTAWGTSHIARVGMFDDCLWANTAHTGTFDITPIDNYYRDLGVFVDQARYAPHSGETCGTSLNEANDVCWVLDNCSNMDQSMFDLSLDLLFYRYSTTIYDKWKSQGGWEEISRKLGYRIALQSITMPASGAPGSAGTLEVTWKNSGSGKVFNPRPIDLVYVGPGGPFTERVTSDARPSMPMPRESDRSGSWAITLPTGLQSGQSYSVYLRLPDPDPLGNGLDADDRYSMRLANTGVWDGATGRHDLGATVTVP